LRRYESRPLIFTDAESTLVTYFGVRMKAVGFLCLQASPRLKRAAFFSIIVLLHRYSDRLSGNTVQYGAKEVKEVGDM
jgi:hypothetical protein